MSQVEVGDLYFNDTATRCKDGRTAVAGLVLRAVVQEDHDGRVGLWRMISEEDPTLFFYASAWRVKRRMRLKKRSEHGGANDASTEGSC